MRSAWGGHHQEGGVWRGGGGRVANANLKHCGVGVTEAASNDGREQGSQVMRGKWEGEKAGVQDAWECRWERGFMNPGCLRCAAWTAARCRIVDDASDA